MLNKKTFLSILVVCGVACANWKPIAMIGQGGYSGLISIGAIDSSHNIAINAGLGSTFGGIRIGPNGFRINQYGTLFGSGLRTINAGLTWDAFLGGTWHPQGETGGFVGLSTHLIQAKKLVTALSPAAGFQKVWTKWGVHTDVSVPVFISDEGIYSRLNTPDDQELGMSTLARGYPDIQIGFGISRRF